MCALTRSSAHSTWPLTSTSLNFTPKTTKVKGSIFELAVRGWVGGNVPPEKNCESCQDVQLCRGARLIISYSYGQFSRSHISHVNCTIQCRIKKTTECAEFTPVIFEIKSSILVRKLNLNRSSHKTIQWKLHSALYLRRTYVNTTIPVNAICGQKGFATCKCAV